MTDRRFVWFAPNAGNWVTYRMEHRVANALADAGEDVLMVQCDSVLDAFCQVMAPVGLSAAASLAEKHAVCRECRFASGLARDRARYRTVQLSQFLIPADWVWVEERLAAVTVDNWEHVAVDGLPVGKYASYTAMLHHKRPTIADSSDSWEEYLADLRGALLVSRALTLMTETTRPTHAVVYNALYPANRVFAEGMRAAGAVLLNLSAGPAVQRRYSTLAVYDGIKASQTAPDSTSFRVSREVPVTELEAAHVEQHVAQLMSGSDPWVYSSAASQRPATTVRQSLGIRPDSPVAVVIVSSPDETRSSLLVDAEYERDPENGYSDVAEFLRASIALTEAHPDVDFVFRLHPRLAPNKRDRRASPDLDAIYGLLAELPSNATINHPTDGLSLYDLVLISDCAVNQSSSAGLEFLAFGLPVVQYDPVRLNAYPPSFGIPVMRGDQAAFAVALDRALAEGFDLRHSVDAFRWYASTQIRSVVHLDPLDVPESPGLSVSSAPVRRSRIGRLLPDRTKEFVAMRLQRRQRTAEMADLKVSEATVDVLLKHVDRSRGEGDIWEPFMMLPTESTSDLEWRLVRDAVRRLSARLASVSADGVGAIRAIDEL